MIKVNGAPPLTPHKGEETKRPPVDWQGHVVLALGAATLTLFVWEAALIIHDIVVDKFFRQDPIALEKKAKRNYPSLVDRVKKFDKIDHHRVIKRLAMSQEDEKNLINYLTENYKLSDEQLQEIFLGAHVRLADDGEAYRKWSKLSKVKHATSSHPSSGAQYRMNGMLVKELVFSVIEEKGRKSTWFQLEGHPVKFGYVIRHMLDYLKYKADGKNRGPDGISPHTHHKPMILMKKR